MSATPLPLVTRLAIAAALVGVFCTWLTDGEATLNGVEGPNDGWLVVILALLAIPWARSMERGSWVGIVGVGGASAVIGWTAVEDWLDARDVLGASVGYGLVVVVAASVVLGATAVARGVELARSGPA